MLDQLYTDAIPEITIDGEVDPVEIAAFSQTPFDDLDDVYVEKVMTTGQGKVLVGDDTGNTLRYTTDERLFYIGGDGDDDIVVTSTSFTYLSGGEGHDTLSGSGEVVRIEGDGGNDILTGKARYLNEIDGGDGNDRIISTNALFSDLEGGRGDDTIIGGAGNDRIDGQQGNDHIHAGMGDDLLTGGDGSDKFIFDVQNWGDDAITDFDIGVDVISIALATGAQAFGDLSISTQLSPNTATGYQTLISYTDPSDPGMINQITLFNIQASQLSESDFIFV